ncbi:hypothetical protein ASF39_12830 [Methylobacterium sp. Leaf108]|nr:hypothetical protein ASF39_12830 [Methylobacterium sp. Leaf108]
MGNAGANTLNGGLNADVMQGLGGNDAYYVDNGNDRVFEAAGGGTDWVLTSVNYTLTAGQEIERLDTTNEAGTGSINLSGNAFSNTLVGNAGVNILNGGAINLSGNAFSNTLVGNAGVNILNGGAGADLLYGRGGSDFYFVDNADDRVFEAAGGGSDKVLTSVNYTLTAGQEIERLDTTNEAGTGSINLSGNAFSNTLVGNAGVNILNGGAINLSGNAFSNTLVGNAGVNILNGGAGADLLYGRGGGDTYLVDNAGDSVTEAAGGGTDRVLTSVSYTLTAGQEIERLEVLDAASTTAINLTGNAFANTLVGNAGANTLNGGLNADVMQGLGGNDAYYVDGRSGDRAAGGAGCSQHYCHQPHRKRIRQHPGGQCRREHAERRAQC